MPLYPRPSNWSCSLLLKFSSLLLIESQDSSTPWQHSQKMAQSHEPPSSLLPSQLQPPAASYSLPSSGGDYNNQHYGNGPPNLPQPPAASEGSLSSTGAVYCNQHYGNGQPQGQPQGGSSDPLQGGYPNQTGGIYYQQQQPFKLDRMPDPWGLQESDGSDAASGTGERNLLRCGCCLVLCAFCIDLCFNLG